MYKSAWRKKKPPQLHYTNLGIDLTGFDCAKKHGDRLSFTITGRNDQFMRSWSKVNGRDDEQNFSCYEDHLQGQRFNGNELFKKPAQWKEIKRRKESIPSFIKMAECVTLLLEINDEQDFLFLTLAACHTKKSILSCGTSIISRTALGEKQWTKKYLTLFQSCIDDLFYNRPRKNMLLTEIVFFNIF